MANNLQNYPTARST